MAEYKSKEDYISAVKQGIKWKRARETATRELSDHIDDLCDKYAAEGTEKEKALQMAIREMGDADLVAAGLNSVYRPRTNWLLIFTVLCMLVFGIAVRAFVFPGGVPLSEVFAVFIGAAAAAAIYFGDYTILIRRPRLFYWILSGITAVSLLYELRGGTYTLGYLHSYYFLLLFPVVMTGIAFYTKEKVGFGALFFSLYFLPPVFAAFLIKSIPMLVYLFLSYLFFLGYMIRHKWVSVSKSVPVTAACVMIIFGLTAFFININLFTRTENYIFGEQGIREEIFRILRGTSLTGGYPGEEKMLFDNWTDNYALVYLAANYGNAAVIITVLIYAALMFLLVKSALRQNTAVGSITAWIVILSTGFQLASGILCNLGLIGARYMMTFPFLTGGGSFAIFNLVLMGVMLSVIRNEDIAKNCFMRGDFNL